MREAVALGLEELSRTLELLRSLEEDDWARPTDCTGWDVHDVVAHLVGQFEGAARPYRLLRRVRTARRMAREARQNNEGEHSDRPGYGVLDGHNELQVRERKGVPPDRLVEELEWWGGRGIRSFGRIPAPLRRMRLSRLFPEAVAMPDDSLDFLIRIIGPRDPWMHRIDICAAVGRPFAADSHDAKIVEQVVADLIELWQPREARQNNEGDLHRRPDHARPPATRHAENTAREARQNNEGEHSDRPGHARPPATRHAETQPGEARQNNEGDLHRRPDHARQPATRHAETQPREARRYSEEGRLPAVNLVLEGPAGGEWVVGQGVPVAEVRCDAIAYCRHASGRPGPDADVSGEREVGEALLEVKISF